MKAAFLTAAAALMGSAMAHEHHRRHDHAALHRRQAESAQESCGCYTTVVTYWGSPTLVPIAEPTTTSTSTTTYLSTSYSTVTVQASTPAVPMPTASVTIFPTPGTYTIPGSTITVTSSTVVPEATTTALPSGTHTIGGVTTVVETSTTIVCPYATVKPTGSTFTSVIETTTYVCPSSGTYTIAPTTTTVPASTVVVYPTPATVTPGTYTKPEQTVTVVETSYTYVCPFATSSTPAPAPAAPKTTAAPAPAPVSPTPVVAAVKTTSASPAPAPASSSPSTSGSSSSGCGLGKHPQYAVTYTGYTHNTGNCMAADEVLTELKNIQANGFYAIRMYSTDCNQLETVATQAISIGLKVILGVYIGQSGVSSGTSQVNDIVQWSKSHGWNGVEFISLDNEALADHYCTASELAGFVSSAKATLKAAGYTGQFTLTEPLDVWQSSGSTLCSVVDFASANLQAFFNSDVTADQAGSFVASEVEILKKICNNDQVFVGESGWPTAGDSNGKAIPGVAEQKAAIDGIRQSIGSIAAQFSYKNDDWKNPGSFNVEQFWGIADMLSGAE